ncbi:MAG: hypothetical protein N2Z79_01190 [Candidatus Omnitrophica bacterium]|nr:hypothetical protein [Candidatus Omnitrophota bacterium]
MKTIVNLSIALGLISLLVAIISRLLVKPIPIATGIEARALVNFANACFLVAITFILLQIQQTKK